jgi:hypothetical protein
MNYLSFECLMLLNLSLEVGGIFVALVGGGLKLFVDPGFEFVGIAAEVLEAAGLLQLLPLDLRGFLELTITSENLNAKEEFMK